MCAKFSAFIWMLVCHKMSGFRLHPHENLLQLLQHRIDWKSFATINPTWNNRKALVEFFGQQKKTIKEKHTHTHISRWHYYMQDVFGIWLSCWDLANPRVSLHLWMDINMFSIKICSTTLLKNSCLQFDEN